MTKKQKYNYWTIEKVKNGYIVKNAMVTAVFNDLEEMLEWLEDNTL